MSKPKNNWFWRNPEAYMVIMAIIMIFGGAITTIVVVISNNAYQKLLAALVFIGIPFIFIWDAARRTNDYVWKCPECGYTYNLFPKPKYCPQCGTRMEAMKIQKIKCPHCGAEIEKLGYAYCPNCGAKLEGGDDCV